uniref:Uncharacterized protein n=1 Tax=Rhipicephalus zambeziensis TaxID=60191 RepID=A0A224Y5Q2_9ACAR
MFALKSWRQSCLYLEKFLEHVSAPRYPAAKSNCGPHDHAYKAARISKMLLPGVTSSHCLLSQASSKRVTIIMFAYVFNPLSD